MGRAIDAWNRDDLGAWLSCFAEDAEWHPYLAVLEGAVFTGRSGLEQVWRDIRADLTLELVAHELVPVPGGVLARLTLRSTARGSGVQLEQPLAQVFRIRDGLITRAQGFADEREALEAVGSQE